MPMSIGASWTSNSPLRSAHALARATGSSGCAIAGSVSSSLTLSRRGLPAVQLFWNRRAAWSMWRRIAVRAFAPSCASMATITADARRSPHPTDRACRSGARAAGTAGPCAGPRASERAATSALLPPASAMSQVEHAVVFERHHVALCDRESSRRAPLACADLRRARILRGERGTFGSRSASAR